MGKRFTILPRILCAASLLLPLAALAQTNPEGLKLSADYADKPYVAGLKLRYIETSTALFSLNAPASLNATLSANSAKKSADSLLLNWSLHERTQLQANIGLVLRYQDQGTVARSTQRELGAPDRIDPYVGLSWQGKIFAASQWKFSADVGSFVASREKCSQASTCNNLKQEGSGIHWTPYLAIGARFDY